VYSNALELVSSGFSSEVLCAFLVCAVRSVAAVIL
jgi:hypothetical protein